MPNKTDLIRNREIYNSFLKLDESLKVFENETCEIQKCRLLYIKKLIAFKYNLSEISIDRILREEKMRIDGENYQSLTAQEEEVY